MKNEATIDGVVVGGQPDAADVHSGRYACVINCRPDGEEGNVTAELVEGRDIVYASVPFTGDTLAASHIDEIRGILEGVTGTALIHCNGGTGKGAQAVFEAIQAAGYDVRNRPYEAFIRQYFARR